MIRVGIGYDIHRLEEGRALVLGGVSIPFENGLSGHSDADALAHAVIDALLGAAALGNIGKHFPDTDPAYKNANSMELLSRTASLLFENGYLVANLDANIVAQRPSLSPYLDEMRDNLARTLRVDRGRISVKAKTNEGVGPEGRGEAISVQAAVLIENVGSE